MERLGRRPDKLTFPRDALKRPHPRPEPAGIDAKPLTVVDKQGLSTRLRRVSDGKGEMVTAALTAIPDREKLMATLTMFRSTVTRSLILAGVLLACLSGAASAQKAAPVCVACDRSPPNVQFWKHTLGLVCNDCKELDRSCWICGLPAHANYKETKDGRFICRREAASAIIDIKLVEKDIRNHPRLRDPHDPGIHDAQESGSQRAGL